MWPFKERIPEEADEYLECLVDDFEDWRKKNCPELPMRKALEKYPGISIAELVKKVSERRKRA